MAIDFPDSPTVDQQYSVGDRTWTWNGTYWQLSQTSSTFTASDTAPINPSAGDIWFESDTGQTFIYYDQSWVEIGAATDLSDILSDADADTSIQVEASSDEDVIRFKTAGTERLQLTSDGHLIPQANVTYDLGSASNRFRDLYLSGSSIDLGGVEISSDGTSLSMPPVSNINGDFTVGTDVLHVDHGNSRVGVGTTTPSYDLDVSGDVNASNDMRIAGVSLDGLIRSAMPVGSVIPFAGASSPDATWLVCDGSAVSRTTYAALFAVLGTTYGVGDGSTTFNIPNMKGRVPVGLDSGQTEFDALGETGGTKTHTLTESEMPSHTHTQNAHNHTQNQHRHSIDHNHASFTTASGGSHTHVLNRSTNGVYSSSGSGIQFQGTAYTGDTVLSTNSNHAHTIDVPNFTGNSGYSTPTNNDTTATNESTGDDVAHNNLQPYMALNYIMKAA